jgi:hypothetical protein
MLGSRPIVVRIDWWHWPTRLESLSTYTMDIVFECASNQSTNSLYESYEFKPQIETVGFSL